jgi:hypothetical protein
MTSQRKVEANRNNARASTGPRSKEGKQRSARNAFRHGLAATIWADPETASAAAALAREIAGPNASEEVLAAAKFIAGAHLDVLRVRQTKRDLIAPGFTSLAYWPRNAPTSNLPNRKMMELVHGPPSPEKLAFVIADLSDDLHSWIGMNDEPYPNVNSRFVISIWPCESQSTVLATLGTNAPDRRD